MSGWIALRFLADPATALEHFAHIDDGMTDPLVLARAAYWRGRAAEAAGQFAQMRAQYEAAARYPTAYYGQLARARHGLDKVVVLRSPPDAADGDRNEVLHAAGILFAIGEGDLALSFVSDLAEESGDPAVIAGLGKLTARYNDAQAMLLVGKTALARGLPMDLMLFRTSACQAIARSAASSIAASSTRSCAPKADSIRATCPRPRRSG